jgi:GTPase
MTTIENMIAVCGPVDAGKSSLIGVLTSGEYDDGNGMARNRVLIHPHELESGRTSNITINPLIYKNIDGHIYMKSIPNCIRKKEIKERKLFEYTGNICKKLISFIDLAGHKKYLKTTVFGVTGMFPDYGIVVIGANKGITRLTLEHMNILLNLNINMIIIITKIDMAPKDVYKKLKNKIKKLINHYYKNKTTFFINNDSNTNDYIEKFNGIKDIIPVISVSNKVGTNICNLHKILYNFPSINKWKNKINGSIVYLDTNYNVPGIGMVVSGSIKGNAIDVKQKMFIGPFNGKFKEVMIRSIHNSIRENVPSIMNNTQGCFAIKFCNMKEAITRDKLIKGLVMIDSIDKWKNNITRKFLAKINILHHATTIKSGYTPVIHCGPVRQAATIKIIDEEKFKHLRTGDTCIVEFTFICHPEFIEEGMVIFFRDGNMKGVGEVISIKK